MTDPQGANSSCPQLTKIPISNLKNFKFKNKYKNLCKVLQYRSVTGKGKRKKKEGIQTTMRTRPGLKGGAGEKLRMQCPCCKALGV